MKKKEEINCKIINASIKEFIAKGFEAASMENISKLAQVSKRTLYKYHPCKDVLLDELITKLLDSCSEGLNISYECSEPFEVQLDKIIRQKVEFITSEEYIQLSKIVLGELLKSKQLTKEQLKKFNEHESKLVLWIDNAKEDKMITSDLASSIIANQLQSLIKGQVFYPAIFGMASIDEDLKEQAFISTKISFLNSFCSK